MSRSGYSEDYEFVWLYQQAVKRAVSGKRGQAFLIALRDALQAMPEKRLIAHELQSEEGVCAIGCLGVARGVDMSNLDPEEPDSVAAAFGIAPALVREIVFENDENAGWRIEETPERRYQRVLDWVERQIAA